MVNHAELLNKYFPDLAGEAVEKLLQLPALYGEWNAKINVVSRKDMDDFFELVAKTTFELSQVQKLLFNNHLRL